jgi:hypothetical protein
VEQQPFIAAAAFRLHCDLGFMPCERWIMKNYSMSLCLASLLFAASAGPVSSQETRTASITPPKTTTSPHSVDGTPVLVELSKGVNAKKAKVGDPVKAQVVQDVLSQGKIVIRRGSKLLGHVTQVKPRSKEDGESYLGLVFDRAKLKGGGELDLNSAGIQAAAAAARYSIVDKPDQMVPSSITNGVGQRAPVTPVGGRSPQGRSAQPTVASPPNLGSATVSPVIVNETKRFEGSVLSGGSRGVFGIPGINLKFSPSRDADRTVLTSTRENVKLDSGVQLLLQVTAPLQH